MSSNTSAIETAGPWRNVHGLRVREVQYRAGSQQLRHRHAEPGLSLVLAGSLEEKSREATIHAEAGSLVIKPAGYWHADAYGPRGARVVQVSPADKSACWSDFGWAYRWQDAPRLVRHVLALWRGRPRAGEGTELAFWETLETMLPSISNWQSTRSPAWWRDALDLLDAAAASPVSVSDVAHKVGVHPVHLARVCRRQLGCSVRQYLLQRRTLSAWRACERGTDSLAAIAARVGFADQAHMTRTFTKLLGISPAKLRQAMRATN